MASFFSSLTVEILPLHSREHAVDSLDYAVAAHYQDARRQRVPFARARGTLRQAHARGARTGQEIIKSQCPIIFNM